MTGPRVPQPKTALARRRRGFATRIERDLWHQLRDRRTGWKFRREAPIGPYVVDFLCAEAKLVVEADGPLHEDAERRAHDRRRDAWLTAAGYKVLRFSETEILGNLGLVLERIDKAVRERAGAPAQRHGQASPSPGRLRRPPSPSRGEGSGLADGTQTPTRGTARPSPLDGDGGCRRQPGEGDVEIVPEAEREKRAKSAKLLVIACGALAREIGDIVEANGLNHIELTCLPAILHNRPEKIPGAVEAAIGKAKQAGYEKILVGYADCGTGGMLDRVCEAEGVARIAGPHCYAFYSGNAAFAAREDADMDAFFLTDFLARQFEAFVIEPLGLDKHPELRDDYFGHYRRLVFLAQNEDAALEEKARAAADRLGLAFEKRVTGYGDLAGFLKTNAPTV